MQTLEEKIEHSIGLIKKYEDDAMRLNGGYTVCFSGGKDSQVLLDLFKKAGVKYKAVYNVTTNDPPENVYFIKQQYPEVEFVLPKLNFYQLIEKNGILPTMCKRFCCDELKEYSGVGICASGVRREESEKRKGYVEIEYKTKAKDKTYSVGGGQKRRCKKVLFRPILEWREDEIWQYIEDNNIPINPCYENYGRVGCIFCPFKSDKQLIYSSRRYPRQFKLFLRSIQRIIDKGYMREFKKCADVNAQSVFEWWISKQSAEKFFTQLKLNFD